MTRKMNNAMNISGFSGYASTCAAIFDQIPQVLRERCTALELSEIAKAINRAYQAGKASTGAEMVDTNAVWINALNRIVEWDSNGVIQ